MTTLAEGLIVHLKKKSIILRREKFIEVRKSVYLDLATEEENQDDFKNEVYKYFKDNLVDYDHEIILNILYEIIGGGSDYLMAVFHK